MKRKVYIKQMKMKMLKEKSKTEKKTNNDQSENSKQSPHPTSKQQSVVSANQSSTASFNVVNSSPLVSSGIAIASPIVSASCKSADTPSVPKNSGPLPTVDVLMKSRSRRAFQLKHKTENFNKNSTLDLDQQPLESVENSSNITNDLDRSNNYMYDRESRSVSWDRDNIRMAEYHTVSSLPPKAMHPSYGIEHSSVYNVSIDQSDHMIHDTNIHSPSTQSPPPVFHQLQPTRMADRITNIETNTLDYSGGHYISGENQRSHDVTSYNGHINDSEEYNNPHIHHHLSNNSLVDGRARYIHDSLPHHEEQIAMTGQEHIRAWEQENYRYVDYTWTNGELPGTVVKEPVFNSSSNIKRSGVIKHGNVLDESLDLTNKKTTRSSTRSSTGGRRRRKRVQTPIQRSAANMRERRRMCHLNVAFDYLKEHLPNVKDKKKLSRIQTLKAAIYYIHLLQDSLNVQ